MSKANDTTSVIVKSPDMTQLFEKKSGEVEIQYDKKTEGEGQGPTQGNTGWFSTSGAGQGSTWSSEESKFRFKASWSD